MMCIFTCCFSVIVIIVCCFVVFCQKYYHGESIAINVLVDNNTSKSVKKIKISGEFKHVNLFVLMLFLTFNADFPTYCWM